jgi:hypothetical protein
MSTGSPTENDLAQLEQRVDKRLLRLETSVESLASSVGKVSEGLGAMQASLESMARRQDESIRRDYERGRINWTGIIAAMGSVLTICGAAVFFAVSSSVAPIARDSTRHDAEIVALRQWQADSAYSSGRNERDIAENAHELDLVWQEMFDMLEWRGSVKKALESP